MLKSMRWGFFNRSRRAGGRPKKPEGPACCRSWRKYQAVECSASRTLMSCQTSWKKSLLSYATNTLSVISLRTSCGTAAGAASRSSSVRPKDCPHSKSTPAPGTMLRPNKTVPDDWPPIRSEEHTSELQSPDHLVCRLLLEKKKKKKTLHTQTVD